MQKSYQEQMTTGTFPPKSGRRLSKRNTQSYQASYCTEHVHPYVQGHVGHSFNLMRLMVHILSSHRLDLFNSCSLSASRHTQSTPFLKGVTTKNQGIRQVPTYLQSGKEKTQFASPLASFGSPVARDLETYYRKE